MFVGLVSEDASGAGLIRCERPGDARQDRQHVRHLAGQAYLDEGTFLHYRRRICNIYVPLVCFVLQMPMQ